MNSNSTTIVQQFVYNVYLFFMVACFLAFVPPIMHINLRTTALYLAVTTLVIKSYKTSAVFSLIKKNNIILCFILLALCALLTYYQQRTSLFNSLAGRVAPADHLTPFLSIVVISLFCVVEFKSFKQFSYIWICLFIVQSAIILTSVVSYSFRMFIYDHFYFGDNRFEETIEAGTRIMGIGIYAANGSLVMSTSCILLVALKIRNQISDRLFYACYLLIFSATMFTGRTGMLVELAVFFYYSIFHGRSLKKTFWTVIAVFGVAGIGSSILSSLDSQTASEIYEWITAAFNEESRESIMEGVEKGGFPPISYDTLVGTGIKTGYVYDGKTYSPDSGYIRSWISLGIFGFCAYYYAIWKLLTASKLRMCPAPIKFFCLFVILIAFIVEYKEPFFMRMRFPLIAFALPLFMAKEQKAFYRSGPLNNINSLDQ